MCFITLTFYCLTLYDTVTEDGTEMCRIYVQEPKKCSKFILIANIKAKLSLQLMKHQATKEYERVKLHFTHP